MLWATAARDLSVFFCSFLCESGESLTVPLSAGAFGIDVSAVNLSDTTPGEDLWRYSYKVFDDASLLDDANEGFTIYFDYTAYGTLSNPTISNADWDLLALSPLPGSLFDGFFDALAVTGNASLADSFEVDFVWLGTGIPPVAGQPYETYACTDVFCSTLDVTSNGVTMSAGTMPVPAPLLLLAGGLIGLAVRRKPCWQDPDQRHGLAPGRPAVHTGRTSAR